MFFFCATATSPTRRHYWCWYDDDTNSSFLSLHFSILYKHTDIFAMVKWSVIIYGRFIVRDWCEPLREANKNIWEEEANEIKRVKTNKERNAWREGGKRWRKLTPIEKFVVNVVMSNRLFDLLVQNMARILRNKVQPRWNSLETVVMIRANRKCHNFFKSSKEWRAIKRWIVLNWV